MTKCSSVAKIISSATWANSSLGTAQWHVLPIDGELVQKSPVYFLSEDKKIFLPVRCFEFVLTDVSESVNELERFHSKNPVDIYILKHRIVDGLILTVFGSVSVRVPGCSVRTVWESDRCYPGGGVDVGHQVHCCLQ